MNDIDKKKLIITRIIAHLNPVPSNCVQELLQQSVADLSLILERLATTRDQQQAADAAEAHAQESIRQSKSDHAWAYALLKVSLNGRFLADTESNKNMVESMLQPTEEPSPAIYETILKQFSNKFSWAASHPKRTKEDERAAFNTFVREHSLSSTDANFNLFKEGAGVENFAGASGIEKALYAGEQAQARQHFLIHDATPTQLRQEANWEPQQNREAFQRAELDRQHQVSSQQQSGMFPPLPAIHAETGEAIDARWLRKTSTINLELFKRLCRRHGSAAVTERLRQQ